MYYRRNTSGSNSARTERVYSTFADWQANQQHDLRSPAQRGIGVGSMVMWRYMQKNIIVTDRAIVTAIAGDRLTLQIKDVQHRFADADVHEIVSSTDDRSSNHGRPSQEPAIAPASASAFGPVIEPVIESTGELPQATPATE